MRKLIFVLPLFFLSTPTLADQPNTQGCYEENYFMPWLDLPSVNCSHPALGDPDHTFSVADHANNPPVEPPPHECPYEKKD